MILLQHNIWKEYAYDRLINAFKHALDLTTRE